MSGKPRPASFGQLISLNGIGALRLVAPGEDPVAFDDAWKALEEAQAQNLWSPKKQRKDRRQDG